MIFIGPNTQVDGAVREAAAKTGVTVRLPPTKHVTIPRPLDALKRMLKD